MYDSQLVLYSVASDEAVSCFSPSSLLQLEVNQFVTTAITPSILSASDDLTLSDQLLFTIDGDETSGECLTK